MTQSFTSDHKRYRSKPRGRARSVLVTGAAGNIGSYFAQQSHRRYDLRLMVRDDEDAATVKDLQRFGDVIKSDITDLDAMKRACAGIDTVVHLAADPSPEAKWQSLLSANIVGCYNTFVAAKGAQCRRIIYASSIHAVSGYPADVQVKPDEPVNPGDLYGVSKCFGEALARYMAEKEDLSSIVLRIGAFQPREAARHLESIGMVDAWVSRRDLNQLIEKSIDVENLRFAILHALSNNRFKRLDITSARVLVGYEPQDDLTVENPKLKKLKLRRRVGAHSIDDGGKSGIRDELKTRPARQSTRKPRPKQRSHRDASR